MRKKKKNYKAARILKSFGIIFILVYMSCILFPQFLFSHKLNYKSFTVYYNEDLDEDQLKLVLNKAEGLLNDSEIFDKTKNQDIFLTDGYNQFTFFALLSKKSFAVNYPLVQNIFVSHSVISEDLVSRNGIENNRRSLSGVIAHETIHSALENEVGLFNYKVMPKWKVEGYADYIAQESSFNEVGLNGICDPAKNSRAYRYYEYRMITKYLFEDKGQSFEEFINEDIDDKKIKEELQKVICQ